MRREITTEIWIVHSDGSGVRYGDVLDQTNITDPWLRQQLILSREKAIDLCRKEPPNQDDETLN